MEGPLQDTITAALDDLEQGNPLEDILARYPQASDELRPILEIASGLSDLPARPSQTAREASRRRFLEEAKHLRQGGEHTDAPPIWRRFMYSFASVALLLALLGVILIPPADEAIPGDILYPVKRGAESLQLILAPDAEKEALRETYERERNHEVYEMLEIGRDGRAGYIGVVKSISPENWEIGNITARINPSTEINGEPEVGARVEAHCLIEDREVIAESLTILEPPSEIGPPGDT